MRSFRMNGNSIRHFFLPFEIHIMVEGGGHETLHAAKLAQNGKKSISIAEEPISFLIVILYTEMQ